MYGDTVRSSKERIPRILKWSARWQARKTVQGDEDVRFFFVLDSRNTCLCDPCVDLGSHVDEHREVVVTHHDGSLNGLHNDLDGLLDDFDRQQAVNLLP